MSTNHTDNYGLCQWEATDPVLRTDFNMDNQTIDATLWKMAETLRTRGDCACDRKYRIGNGTSGASAPSELIVTRPPIVVFVGDRETGYTWTWQEGAPFAACPWYPNSKIYFEYKTRIDANGKRVHFVRWYSDTAEHQFNVKDRVYNILALYCPI